MLLKYKIKQKLKFFTILIVFGTLLFTTADYLSDRFILFGTTIDFFKYLFYVIFIYSLGDYLFKKRIVAAYVFYNPIDNLYGKIEDTEQENTKELKIGLEDPNYLTIFDVKILEKFKEEYIDEEIKKYNLQKVTINHFKF